MEQISNQTAPFNIDATVLPWCYKRGRTYLFWGGSFRRQKQCQIAESTTHFLLSGRLSLYSECYVRVGSPCAPDQRLTRVHVCVCEQLEALLSAKSGCIFYYFKLIDYFVALGSLGSFCLCSYPHLYSLPLAHITEHPSQCAHRLVSGDGSETSYVPEPMCS